MRVTSVYGYTTKQNVVFFKRL